MIRGALSIGSRGDGRRQVHTEIAANSHRYIKPEDWRGSEGLSILAESPSEEAAAGWNRSNMPLCCAEMGTSVVNCYFLGRPAVLLHWRRYCLALNLAALGSALNVKRLRRRADDRDVRVTAVTEGAAYGRCSFLPLFLSRGPNVRWESHVGTGQGRVKKEEVKAEPAFDNRSTLDARLCRFLEDAAGRTSTPKGRVPNIASTDELFWKDCDENNICARADDASALDAGSICALKRSRAAVGAADPGNGERADAATVVARAAPGLCAGRRGRGERRRVHWVGHEFYDSIRALSEPSR